MRIYEIGLYPRSINVMFRCERRINHWCFVLSHSEKTILCCSANSVLLKITIMLLSL